MGDRVPWAGGLCENLQAREVPASLNFSGRLGLASVGHMVTLTTATEWDQGWLLLLLALFPSF